MPSVHDVFCPDPETEHSPPPTRAFSVRVPETLLAYLDEMAQIAGVSRNTMTIHVLDWGVRSALEKLPEDLMKRVLGAVDPVGYVAPYPVE